MRKRTIGVIAVPLVALVLACSSGDKQGTTTSPGDNAAAAASKAVTTVAVGQPLTFNRTIITTKTAATITVSNPRIVKAPNQFQTPDKGQFLVVDVSVQVAEGKLTISQASFKLVGKDGTVFDTTLPVTKPDLGAADLAPGQKTSGAVTFDVAAGADKGGKVALTDLFAGDGDVGYWQL